MALPLPIECCRKRVRNPNEDEASEFTPLSKRINNLHLNAFPLTKPYVECGVKMEPHKELIVMNERLPPVEYDTSGAINNSQGINWPEYTPDLNSSQNPFYYEPNRFLFELYQQRIQRQHTSQPHF